MRVRKAGVVGAGTMGAAIAEVLAFNDIEVVLSDTSLERAQAGVTQAHRLVEELVAFHRDRASKEIERLNGIGLTLTAAQKEVVAQHYRPKISESRGREISGRVRAVSGFGAFGDVDLAIEAVFERAESKRAVLAELDRAVPPHAPIGTNTSSLSVSALALGLGHRERVLLTHFFNPPSTLPLVEVSAGLDTRPELVDEVVEFLQGLRNHRYPMVPIRVRESPGYVVNRILLPVMNEAGFVLDEGLASSRDIDLAMTAGAGLPMGPFELADLVGLDVTLEVAETLARETGDPKYRPSAALRRRVAAGHLGRKTGRGFYEYP